MAAYETFEKTHFEAVAHTDVARAAHEKFKKTVAELHEYHPSVHEVQELQGKLDDSTRNVEHLERCKEESQAELVRLRKVNTDLLSGAISRLDDLKGEKQ